jgi:hypothetical protein
MERGKRMLGFLARQDGGAKLAQVIEFGAECVDFAAQIVDLAGVPKKHFVQFVARLAQGDAKALNILRA